MTTEHQETTEGGMSMVERTPYYLDGEHLGTCLPINAHRLEVWLEWGSAVGKVLCPDEGGCTIENDGKRPGCWLADWWGEVGWEMYGVHAESVLIATLPIEGKADDDGPLIWVPLDALADQVGEPG